MLRSWEIAVILTEGIVKILLQEVQLKLKVYVDSPDQGIHVAANRVIKPLPT
jgi:hypothetical protein